MVALFEETEDRLDYGFSSAIPFLGRFDRHPLSVLLQKGLVFTHSYGTTVHGRRAHPQRPDRLRSQGHGPR